MQIERFDIHLIKGSDLGAMTSPAKSTGNRIKDWVFSIPRSSCGICLALRGKLGRVHISQLLVSQSQYSMIDSVYLDHNGWSEWYTGHQVWEVEQPSCQCLVAPRYVVNLNAANQAHQELSGGQDKLVLSKPPTLAISGSNPRAQYPG